MPRNHSIPRIAFLGIAFALTASLTFAQKDSGLPEIVPPEIQDKKSIKLPAVVHDLDVGGGGRYILLHLKALRKIAVFDVNTLKIKGYISTRADDVKFAAGANHAVVLSTVSGMVSRWSLETLECELTKTMDATPDSIKTVLLGSASNGPVLVALSDDHRHGGELWELDMKGINRSLLGENHNAMRSCLDEHARISANGRAVSSGDLQTLTRTGEKWKYNFSSSVIGGRELFHHPSADGRYILSGNAVFTSELKLVGDRDPPKANPFGKLRIPATQGPFYLDIPYFDSRFQGQGGGAGREDEAEPPELMMLGSRQPLAAITGLEPIEYAYPNQRKNQLGSDKQIIFIPDANLIVQVASTGDCLNCHKLDVVKSLAETGIDFLVVTSRPAESLKVDQKFHYPIKSLSNAKQLTYKLESAPKGMLVDEFGLITWTPSKDSPSENSVIVAVASETGQETFHTFQLQVEGASEKPVRQIASDAKKSSPPVEAIVLNKEPKEIKLPAPYSKMAVGGSGRYLLYHLDDLMKIAVVDITKGEIVNYIPATDANTVFAASQDKLLVFGNDQGVVSRWNLATQERELTVNSPFEGNVTEIALGCSSHGPAIVLRDKNVPASPIAFFDIDTLKVHEVEWKGGTYFSGNINRNHGYNNLHSASRGNIFTVSGNGPIRLDRNQVEFRRDHKRGIYLPSADGKYFFSRGYQVNFDLNSTVGSKKFGTVIPGVTGNFFLSFEVTANYPSARNPRQILTPKLFMYGQSRPMVNLPNLKLRISSENIPGYSYQYSGLTNRICFVPEAKVVVMSSPTKDSLTLHQLDVDRALEESGVDYLMVTSNPQSQIKIGEDFAYTLEVKSKNGGLKFKLETGPLGMSISNQGRVTWKVPQSLKAATTTAIVSVTDATQQEVFHTITLTAPEVAERIAQLNTEKRIQRDAEVHPTIREQQIAPEKAQSFSAPMTFPVRQWTDRTGQHKVSAAFVRIDSKTTVVLADENDKTTTISLNELSPEDIYKAVELDLQRLRRNSNTSPFPNVNDGSSRTIYFDNNSNGAPWNSGWGNFRVPGSFPPGTNRTILHGENAGEVNNWLDKAKSQKDK